MEHQNYPCDCHPCQTENDVPADERWAAYSVTTGRPLMVFRERRLAQSYADYFARQWAANGLPRTFSVIHWTKGTQ